MNGSAHRRYLRTLEEIRVDILAAVKETEGHFGKIVGGTGKPE